jgi:hypothetical protein
LLLPSLWPGLAAARTVYRCVQGNTVSLATAPEPGSRCTPKEIDDNAIQTPNLWGNMGVFSGVLYEREQDGALVYSTRNLPGSRVFLKFYHGRRRRASRPTKAWARSASRSWRSTPNSSRLRPRLRASMTRGCARLPMLKATSMRWRCPARAHRA